MVVGEAGLLGHVPGGGVGAVGRWPAEATATCGTIRLKLLKIGAQVRRSVRRIKIAMASACPYQTEYHLAHLRGSTPERAYRL